MRSYPHTEATMREIDRSIELAKKCQHQNTKRLEVDAAIMPDGTLIDGDIIEVCTEYYCGKIVRSGL